MECDNIYQHQRATVAPITQEAACATRRPRRHIRLHWTPVDMSGRFTSNATLHRWDSLKDPWLHQNCTETALELLRIPTVSWPFNSVGNLWDSLEVLEPSLGNLVRCVGKRTGNALELHWNLGGGQRGSLNPALANKEFWRNPNEASGNSKKSQVANAVKLSSVDHCTGIAPKRHWHLKESVKSINWLWTFKVNRRFLNNLTVIISKHKRRLYCWQELHWNCSVIALESIKVPMDVKNP